MQPEDRVRIEHMREAAQTTLAFVEGRKRSDLDSDRLLLFAVVRALEVVGEAANKVSPTGRAALPQLPWRAIIGMRNRLIHGYFAIDTEIVWNTTQREIPALVALLDAALPSQP